MKRKYFILLWGLYFALSYLFAQEISSPLKLSMKKAPKAGTVKEISHLPEFETTEWILSNGTKVLLKPTSFQKNEVIMDGFSWGGTSVMESTDVVVRKTVNDLIRISGIGPFSEKELEKISDERNISVTPTVEQIFDRITGTCHTQDFETMLQLVYLYFTENRMDEAAFKLYAKEKKAELKRNSKNPQVIFADSIDQALYNSHPLKTALKPKELKKINYEKTMPKIKDRFGDIDNFTFIFVGDFDPETVKPLVELYLGGIPASQRKENWENDKTYIGIKNSRNEYASKIATSNSSVYMLYFGKMLFTPQNDIYLTTLTKLLDIKNRERLSEYKNNIHNLTATSRMEKYPHELFFFDYRFDVDPHFTDIVINVLKDGLNKIIMEGFSASDLKQAKEEMLADYRTALQTNEYYIKALNDYTVLTFDRTENFESFVNDMDEADIREFAEEISKRVIVKEVIQKAQ